MCTSQFLCVTETVPGCPDPPSRVLVIKYIQRCGRSGLVHETRENSVEHIHPIPCALHLREENLPDNNIIILFGASLSKSWIHETQEADIHMYVIVCVFVGWSFSEERALIFQPCLGNGRQLHAHTLAHCWMTTWQTTHKHGKVSMDHAGKAQIHN